MLHDRRAVLDRHRVLAWAYAVLAVLAVALTATGHIGSTLGVYGETVQGHLVPGGIGRAVLDHVAVLALGLAILPFIIAAAWLVSTLMRPKAIDEIYAFAAITLVTTLVVVLEGALFDVRNGYGTVVVRDRYLFYAVPLLLIAFFCALGDRAGSAGRSSHPQRSSWPASP